MMTPHNSSLAYESLPTEEGGAPRSSSHRDPEFSPSISRHPIPSPGASYRKGKFITGVLVTLLLLASVILGLIIAISARRDAYHKVFGPDLGVDSTGDDNGFSGHSDLNTGNSDGHFQPLKYGDGGELGEKTGGQEGLQTPIFIPGSTMPPPPSSTTTTTTSTTTTTTTPKPTTTTTTTTTPAPTTTKSTTPTPPTTPMRTEPPTTAAAASVGSALDSGAGDEHLPLSSDAADDYDSDMRAVDYMVMLQKKMTPGVAVAVLVVLVLACMAAVVALLWLIRRRSTAKRRREHVRRAINELRDQGKAGLLQSDDEA